MSLVLLIVFSLSLAMLWSLNPGLGVRGGDLKENQLIGSSSPYFKIGCFLQHFQAVIPSSAFSAFLRSLFVTDSIIGNWSLHGCFGDHSLTLLFWSSTPVYAVWPFICYTAFAGLCLIRLFCLQILFLL